MTKTLIDTSAWIDFFRNNLSLYAEIVATLIEQDAAVITGPVVAELLQGLKSRREADNLQELLTIIPYAEVTHDDWSATGNLLGKLRRHGITVPLTDALIAVIAKRNDYNVLTLDHHFDHLEAPLYPVGIQ